MAINHLCVSAIDNYGVNGPQGGLLRRVEGEIKMDGDPCANMNRYVTWLWETDPFTCAF